MAYSVDVKRIRYTSYVLYVANHERRYSSSSIGPFLDVEEPRQLETFGGVLQSRGNVFF